ncbi:hypothetical protein NQZ68_000714 [Dissostichus eleginoides]|nr:hypothetical protein NQZ68_000714 [Dissostichus eleginoides]
MVRDDVEMETTPCQLQCCCSQADPDLRPPSGGAKRKDNSPTGINKAEDENEQTVWLLERAEPEEERARQRAACKERNQALKRKINKAGTEE